MFKHLPTIPCHKKVLDFDRKLREKPLATKWLPLRGTGKVVENRELLDLLQMTDVMSSHIWIAKTSNLWRSRHISLATSELG